MGPAGPFACPVTVFHPFCPSYPSGTRCMAAHPTRSIPGLLWLCPPPLPPHHEAVFRYQRTFPCGVPQARLPWPIARRRGPCPSTSRRPARRAVGGASRAVRVSRRRVSPIPYHSQRTYTGDWTILLGCYLDTTSRIPPGRARHPNVPELSGTIKTAVCATSDFGRKPINYQLGRGYVLWSTGCL